jgi:hypothetical protein
VSEENIMPVGPGKYRVMTTKGGAKIRLHFGPGGKVNEAKNLKTGATHTPAEFKADAKKGSMAAVLSDHRAKGAFKSKTKSRSRAA